MERVEGADHSTARLTDAERFAVIGQVANALDYAHGEQVSSTVTWSGTTSSPGCTKPRTQVQPERYRAVATAGDVESKPITFTIVR